MFAAITCAEANAQARVLLIEKGTSLLAKVRVSGGGRCNVTHACFEPRELVKHYPRGSRELLGPFHRFQPRDTVAWFKSRGVELKTEEDRRMFPITDSSQTIVDCLLDAAKRAGVEVRMGAGLVSARLSVCEEQPLLLNGTHREMGSVPVGAAAGPSGKTFELALTDGNALGCSQLLIASGGLKPGPIFDSIKGFGHTITALAPSLFTFHIADPRIGGLPGLSVPNAKASILETPFVQTGPVLITHWGLSGPAILRLSAWAARWAQEQGYRFTLRVNWAGLSSGVVQARRDEARRLYPNRLIRNTPIGGLPGRLWERLAAAAGIAEGTKWSQLRREQGVKLTNQLTACDLAVTGKSMFKEEFVTCGGVALKEINFKTMESRLVPGLYFAGEVLDIDGVTGGFNFQAAWTAGQLAGSAMGARALGQ